MAKLNWNPWMRMEDFREQMERLLDETIMGVGRSTPTEKGYMWFPAADVLESGNEFIIQADLPGLSLEDVKVEIKENDLWIYGERPFPKDADRSVYQMLERSYGPFARKFSLWPNADRETIKAALKDGLLTVTIPKKSFQKGRRKILIDQS